MVGIFCECSILIRLFAHPFVSYHIVPSERFVFVRWRVDIEA